jgi:hypothetical protein
MEKVGGMTCKLESAQENADVDHEEQNQQSPSPFGTFAQRRKHRTGNFSFERSPLDLPVRINKSNIAARHHVSLPLIPSRVDPAQSNPAQQTGRWNATSSHHTN